MFYFIFNSYSLYNGIIKSADEFWNNTENETLACVQRQNKLIAYEKPITEIYKFSDNVSVSPL